MADLKQLRSALTAHIRAQESGIELFIKSLDGFLKDNLSRVIRDIESGKQSGMEAAKTLGRLEEILRAGGLEKQVSELRKLYARDLEHIRDEFGRQDKQAVLSDADRPLVEALIDFDAKQVTNQVSLYVDDVRSTIMRGVIIGDVPEFSELHGSAGTTLQRNLNSELNTAFSAFNRTVTLKKAQDVGFELFIYLGPGPTGPNDKIIRPFCRKLLEKRDPPIYTIDEINKMDNGQDLPVATYGGGYNCRHQWRPISEERARELGYAG